MVMEYITPILQGAGSGFIIGLVGYFKANPKMDLEGFEWKKIAPVCVTSAIVGGYAIYSGLTYNMAYDSLIAGGLGIAVNHIIQAVYKTIKNAKN